MLGLAIGTLGPAGVAGGAALDPCRARLGLEPSRAFVGQLVLHRQVVVSPASDPPEWTVPPRFPGFRVERPAGGASASRIGEGPGAAVRIESTTALFPVRAGRWRLPDARVRCAAREIDLPGPDFEAWEPPAEGRPAGWTGVVGALSVAAAAEGRVGLGRSVRVHVTIQGTANLWAARPALRVVPADTEVFAREPRIALPGGPSLAGVRHDAFDLVPRRAGRLRVEPLRIPYLDPSDGRYHVAESEPLTIRVLAAAEGDEGAADGGEGAAPGGEGAAARPGPGGRRRLPGVGGLLALGLAAGAAGLAARRLAARRRDPVRRALRDARRAREPDRRAAALERGLRAVVESPGARGPGVLESSPEEDVREACRRALARLERARFGGPGGEADLDLDGIESLLARCTRG